LGEEKYNENVIEDEYNEKKYTKREAINSLAKTTTKNIYPILPEKYRGENDGRIWRRVLVSKTKGMNEGASFTFPVFNEKCRACGMCKMTCPGKCISDFKSDDGNFYMVHFSYKCSECGVCKEVCMWDGIDGYAESYFENPDSPMVYKTSAMECQICKNACGPEGICINCATKYRNAI